MLCNTDVTHMETRANAEKVEPAFPASSPLYPACLWICCDAEDLPLIPVVERII